jgi:3-oxoacyl-[acyl-carrier-protein] synthase II
MTRRVVITGIGLVSPFGCDLEEFWRALSSGRSGVDRVTVEGRAVVGAPVTGFVARDRVDPKSLRLMAPAVAFGVAAADLAMANAGLATGIDTIDPVRLGAFIGSRGHSSDRQDLLAAVTIAARDGEFRLDRYGAEGLPLVHPMWLLKGLANNVLYFTSLKHHAQGMNNNLSMGGVASAMAIGEAFEAIGRGYIDTAFAGGYDSSLDIDRVEMFGVSGLVTSSDDPGVASRPFDRHRDGFVPGEGAAFVVLETLAAAAARGATMYAEVLGYGNAAAPLSPAHLGPSARGFAGALRAAIAEAGGRTPEAVLALGLGTRESDAQETAALKTVLGASARTTPVSAISSMIGNTFAASGALTVASALLALRHGALPPTIHLTAPDPECDLDYVAGTAARPAAIRTIAINNANLGGAHAALLLGRVE